MISVPCQQLYCPAFKVPVTFGLDRVLVRFFLICARVNDEGQQYYLFVADHQNYLAMLVTVVLLSVVVTWVVGEADPQLPGVFVPMPQQLYGSDGGQRFPSVQQMLYSYR